MLTGEGRLLRAYDGEFIADVDYKLYEESGEMGMGKWWGELILSDSKRVTDGDGYLIELRDARKGRCSLRKRVNRAVMGIPPRYFYHMAGVGTLI